MIHVPINTREMGLLDAPDRNGVAALDAVKVRNKLASNKSD